VTAQKITATKKMIVAAMAPDISIATSFHAVASFHSIPLVERAADPHRSS
jgi:hypothetical protein